MVVNGVLGRRLCFFRQPNQQSSLEVVTLGLIPCSNQRKQKLRNNKPKQTRGDALGKERSNYENNKTKSEAGREQPDVRRAHRHSAFGVRRTDSPRGTG